MFGTLAASLKAFATYTIEPEDSNDIRMAKIILWVCFWVATPLSLISFRFFLFLELRPLAVGMLIHAVYVSVLIALLAIRRGRYHPDHASYV